MLIYTLGGLKYISICFLMIFMNILFFNLYKNHNFYNDVFGKTQIHHCINNMFYPISYILIHTLGRLKYTSICFVMIFMNILFFNLYKNRNFYNVINEKKFDVICIDRTIIYFTYLKENLQQL